MTLISIHVPVLGTPDAARARARRPRSPRARCAAVAPRAHQAVTGARHLLGVAYARRPPLRDAVSICAASPPGGMLVGSAPSASLRGLTRPGPLLLLAALALTDAVTSARHTASRCCVCPPAALAGCRQYLRRQPPRRDAGRLRSVGLFARVDAARAAALARGPCAHRGGDERPSPPLYVAARVCPAPM